MSKWSKVENGIVVETTDVDPAGRFVKEIELQFISCGDGVKQGYIYANGVFSAPAEEIFTTVEKIAALDAEYMPRFAELARAWAIANMNKSTDITAAREADLVTLQAEYDKKRSEIENG